MKQCKGARRCGNGKLFSIRLKREREDGTFFLLNSSFSILSQENILTLVFLCHRIGKEELRRENLIVGPYFLSIFIRTNFN